MKFTLATFQNEYLPTGGTTVDAIVTITGTPGEDAASPPPRAVEILIIDTSGSMNEDRKLPSAKRATDVAIDTLADGVLFAVIAGTSSSRRVYPPIRSLAVASPKTRAAAHDAVEGLQADGGTAMSTWLAHARQLFAKVPDAVKHAILLTDGQNTWESKEQLHFVLELCAEQFQCDCRGVGTDWNVSELREISSRLLGTVDIIPNVEDMPSVFRALVDNAMGKQAHDVAVEVWTPQGATVDVFSQVSPAIEDLTGLRRQVDTLVGSYATGAWGSESREYHLRITVPQQAAGDRMLAGRVRVVVDGETVGEDRILATWTDDPVLSTRINPEVAHFTGQVELARAIQVGLDAYGAGDKESATMKLGQAYQLATTSGNDGTVQLLRKVIDVDDGTVRLRSDIELLDTMTLDTRSTKTVRLRSQV